MKLYKSLMGLVTMACMFVSNIAMAATAVVDTSSLSLDTEASLVPWVLTILGGLAIIWVVRKMIKTTNRS